MKFSELAIAKIDEGTRAREEYGELEELAESIKEKGIIQPITVTSTKAGYLLLAGGRRLRASKLAGLEKIPAVIRSSVDKVDLWEVELAENIQRKDFSWQERIKLEEKIYKSKVEEDSNWSQRKTATLLGRARSALSQDLELADAMKVCPDLGKADTQNEAWKKWDHIKNDLAVKAIVKKQKEEAKEVKPTAPLAPTARSRFFNFQEYISTKYIIKDCFEGMSEVGSSIIDFVEVDPPYAVDLASHRKKAQDQHIVSTYNEIDDADYHLFLKKLFKDLFRIMKPHSWGILWYGSKWYPIAYSGLGKAGFKVCATPAVWVKSGGGYSPNPKLLLSNLYENFLVFRKGNPMLLKQGRGNVFQFSQPSSKERIHPTERPIEMMEELLEIFTTQASIICVPFLGSGVTLKAAFNTDRVAFGYDKDPTYRDRLIAREAQDE